MRTALTRLMCLVWFISACGEGPSTPGATGGGGGAPSGSGGGTIEGTAGGTAGGSTGGSGGGTAGSGGGSAGGSPWMAPDAGPGVPVAGPSRGYLTTPMELQAVAQKAAANVEPYKSAVATLVSYVGTPSRWPYAGFADAFDRDRVDAATTLIYGKALAFHVTGDAAYAASVRGLLLEAARKNLDSDGDELGLARHVPGFVAAADLLEGYSGWTTADKLEIQNWLRGQNVYGVLDEISHRRGNNWGYMGSGAAAYVADYLTGSGLLLVDRNGMQVTPGAAWRESNLKGIARMNAGDGVMNSGTCPDMTGIWPSGRIPHETGRGSTGCNGEYLLAADSSWGYMIAAANGLVRHAELMLRRGDRSMYDNLTSNGRGSLLQAIRYVIDNPLGSHDWDDGQIEILEPAYRYYRHPAIAAQLGVGTGARVIASVGGSSSSGPNGFLDFTTLTHGFAPNENPTLPPTVAPPQ